jgi:hypothetical protein
MPGETDASEDRQPIVDSKPARDAWLTQLEQDVLHHLGIAFWLWLQTGVKGNDLAEFAQTIHHAQHAVMAQAAARAHPDLYRLADGTPP